MLERWLYRGCGAQRGFIAHLEAEAKDGFPEEKTEQSRGWKVSFLVAGCCTLEFEGTGAEKAPSGGGDMMRGDLESPPEQWCAGCWKRERLGPARECGERQ